MGADAESFHAGYFKRDLWEVELMALSFVNEVKSSLHTATAGGVLKQQHL
jgi:hypothetical protein